MFFQVSSILMALDMVLCIVWEDPNARYTYLDRIGDILVTLDTNNVVEILMWMGTMLEETVALHKLWLLSINLLPSSESRSNALPR